MRLQLYTVGHSTRTLAELVALLREFNVQALADVRRWPSSKRLPQFNRDSLEAYLPQVGVEYLWLGRELGGFIREGLGENSPNKAWRSEGFRNYADHTLTTAFAEGVERLLSVAQAKTTAYMCAEKLPWRCHRRIVSDYVTANGYKVVHLIDLGRAVEHRLPSFARVNGERLTYPARG
ncbi:MAG: DUF488 domain-containing protein [Candidatus Bathyarchaeia archaeon]